MGILKIGDKMKKILILLNLCLIMFCSACKLDVYDYDSNDEKVPLSNINVTGTTKIETDLTKLYSNTIKSVVTVLNYASYYDRGSVVTSLYGSGSGFIYAADDSYIYLYTNAHVVSVSKGFNQSYYEIVFYDGYRSYGNLISKDSSEDVAIMKVSRDSYQDFLVASIGNSEKVIPGEDVFTIGSPLGLNHSNTITKGIISNVNVSLDTDDDNDGNFITMYMIHVDAALNPGNSGGPLFNMKGEVIGVNTLKLMSNENGEDVESFNFSIPINHFVNVSNSLVDTGTYSRPIIGISVIDIRDMTLKERENNEINVNKGIYIESVSNSDSLLKGDIIIKINEHLISDIKDFSVELYKYKKGDKISVTIVDKNGSNEVIRSIVLK